MATRLRILVPVLLLCSSCRCQSGTDSRPGPTPALQPMSPSGALSVSDGDRCPVCAMEVAKHPKFSCGMELTDGLTFYFCGTGCLIRTWLHPEVYLGAERDQIERMQTRDYFSGAPLDAMDATWVTGSDVMGPMGPAIIPLAHETDLPTFESRHGAGRTFRLDEMNDDLWLELTGKPAARQDQK